MGRTRETETGAESGRRGDAVSADRRRKKAELIQNLLDKIEDQVSKKEFKASIADLIRLLQLQKDLEEEQPREITVTWIEPPETENAPAR